MIELLIPGGQTVIFDDFARARFVCVIGNLGMEVGRRMIIGHKMKQTVRKVSS